MNRTHAVVLTMVLAVMGAACAPSAGARGDTGPAGATGPQGPRGEAGPAGAVDLDAGFVAGGTATFRGGAQFQADLPGSRSILTHVLPDGGQVSLSTNGVYCGVTGATTMGRISYGALFGFPAAKVLCEQTCSSPTAHMCSGEEVIRSLQLQALPRPAGSSVPIGYFATGVPAPATASASSTMNDCLGWTAASASSSGAYLLGSSSGEFWYHSAACDQNALPIVCCN